MRKQFEKLVLPCKLEDVELIEMVRELADRADARDTVDAELKEIQKEKKEVIARQEGRIFELAKLVRAGYQDREVDCSIIFDDVKGAKTWYRQDTGEIVKTEPMSLEEYQQEIPVEAPPEEKGKKE